MKRSFYRLADTILANKASIFGLGVGVFLWVKMSRSFGQLNSDENVKRMYDPVKARAQIEVYKEVYNMGSKEDNAVKILECAEKADRDKMEAFFEKTGDKSEIEREMERLQREIESLEEVKS